MHSEVQSVFPPVFGQPTGSFGIRVALDATTMAIASGYGIEMRERIGDAWTPSGLLTDSGAKSAAALALDGDVLVVGLPDAVNPSLPAGAALVYERSGGTWSLATTLHAGDAQFAEGFGAAVDVSGARILIGAASAGQISGAAWVFERNGGVWSQTAKLPPVAPDIGFATAVALDGDRALVTAPFAPFGSAQGGALVYELAGTQWLPTGVLLPPSPQVAQKIGRSCALDGTRAVLGSNGTTGGEVYELQSGSWSHAASLPLPIGGGTSAAVAISGARVLIGTSQRDAFVYTHAGGAWSAPEQLLLLGHAPTLLMLPGAAVALDGDNAAVGTPNILYPGLVYAHSVGGAGCPRLLGLPQTVAVSNQPAAQYWQLEAGSAHANRVYLMLGSLSGTAPGITLDGQLLPLVPDAYTTYTLTAPNSPPLVDTLGVLDANGSALARFQVPAGSTALAGISGHHAYVVLDLAAGVVALTSNAVGVAFKL
ncbi:MAG: hypothetical protein EPO68_03735 [Planctomycetota bacterium]|nr:MAG: hypothetical protein EPO68_03735 [Planctomycetota bacterium]